MNGLIFKPDEHTYWFGGQRIPSVTEVIQSSDHAVDYSDVPDTVLLNKAGVGKLVHKTVEEYLENRQTLITDNPRANRYLEGFAEFVHYGNYSHLFSELQLLHRKYHYAGTVDMVGYVDGRLAVIDVKTTYTLHENTVKLQLAAYRQLVQDELDETVEQAYALHLVPGSYKLVNLTDPFAFPKFLDARRKLKEQEGV